MRTETIEVRGADDVELRVRETAHGPLISDVSSEFATVGANAPTDEPGDRGSGYAVALAWTALDPAPTADAILGLNRASDWDEFREAASDFAVPGAEHGVRRPRGPHRLPGARPDPDPSRRQRRHDARRGLDQRQRLDRRLRPLRRTAERPGPGGGVHRHRQPGGHRRELPLPPHRGLGLRLPLDPHPRGAHRRGRAVGGRRWRACSSTRRTRWPRRWCPTSSTSRTCPPLLPQRPGPAPRLGLHASPPTARRRRTSTSCGATCSS